MTEDKYRKITECISGIKHGPKMVRLLDQLVTMIIFLLYPVLLGELYLLDRSDLLLPVLVVPATGFVVVSLMRHVIHSKRPYEVYDFTPIIQKETVEHSFPSRHVCSAVLIAMAFLQLDVSNGLEILLLAAILSAHSLSLYDCSSAHTAKAPMFCVPLSSASPSFEASCIGCHSSFCSSSAPVITSP